MSIDLDYQSLTTGPSGEALAAQIQSFIHAKFQAITLPRFLQSVHVHSFSFGPEAPELTVKDITDPLPDFYEEDYESGDETGDERAAEEGREQYVEGQEGEETPQLGTRETHIPPPVNTKRASHIGAKSAPTSTNVGGAAGGWESLSSPVLGVNTPGIPGGSSNLAYFHLPGLSGTQTTLTAAAAGRGHHGAKGSTSTRHDHRNTDSASSMSPPSTSASNQSNLSGPTNPLTSTAPRPSSSLLTPPSPSTSGPHPADFQILLHVSYTGTLQLSLTASILLDYPMPSFVGIPVHLNITGLSFDGVAVVAYITRPSTSSSSSGGGSRSSKQNGEEDDNDNDDADDAKQRRAHFCFLAPEDASALVGDVSQDSQHQANDEAEPVNLDQSQPRDPSSSRRDTGLGSSSSSGGSLLRHIRVESEIGHRGAPGGRESGGSGAEGGAAIDATVPGMSATGGSGSSNSAAAAAAGAPTLKNVGKVERFVLEQVRRIFEEELVYPSFWTFLV